MRPPPRFSSLFLALAILVALAGTTPGRERKALLRLPKLSCDAGQPPRALAEAGLQAADVGDRTIFTSEQARAYKLALRCLELAAGSGVPAAALPPRTLAVLGHLYEQQEQPHDAWQAYKRFLREVPEAQRPRELTILAERRSDVLLPRIGQLRVKGPAGKEVAVDGRPAGRTPLQEPIGVPPGRHNVRLGPAEQPLAVLEVEVDAGQTEPVNFADVVAPPPPALLSPEVVLPRRPAWRIGLGAASLLGAALFIGFGGSALSVNGQCVQQGCPAHLDTTTGDLLRDRFASAGFGGGLIGGGVVLLAAGVVLLALPPKRPAPEAARPAPAAP